MRSIIIIFLIIVLGYGGYIFYFNYYAALQPVISNNTLNFEVGESDNSPYKINIMTYNINHGLGIDGVYDLNRVSEIIKPAQIIALNEVDKNLFRTNFDYQSRWLGEKLGYNHVFGPAFLNGVGSYGNALLTVFPIIDAKNYKLPISRRDEPRGLLEVTLRISDNKELMVLVTHLSVNNDIRNKQLQWIEERIDKIDHSYILMGDFNQQPIELEGAKILTDGQKTYPVNNPEKAIDHVYCSSDLKGSSSNRNLSKEEKFASDHLPISVDIF